MSFSQGTVQPATPAPAPALKPEAPSMLAALMLSVYAAQLSRRQLRRLKRKALWMLAKEKFRSFFSRRGGDISTRTLLYIILGILVLVLAFTVPILAIIVLLGAVIYLLLTSN